jgi:hypothetical protein
VVGSSEKKQVSAAGTGKDEESRNPRERIVLTDLAADHDHDYLIRIKAKSANFTATDRVRVLITSSREGFLDPKTGAPTDAVQFLDASGKNEIYPPADNPLVLTVGDASPISSVGPTADHRRKPDIILESSDAAFSNGDLTSGASNAAAYFAGVVALMKAAEPGLRTRHLLYFAHQDNTTSVLIGPPDMGPPPAQSQIVARRPPSQAILRTQAGPIRIRAGGASLTYIPRPAAAPQPSATNNAPPAERLRVPPHEVTSTTSQSIALRRVWRTPTREHLAEVVHDKIK